MNVKGTLVNIDDAVIDAARREGYRKGWNDRRLHDSGIIEDAIRESRNFREFIAALRERDRRQDRDRNCGNPRTYS